MEIWCVESLWALIELCMHKARPTVSFFVQPVTPQSQKAQKNLTRVRGECQREGYANALTSHPELWAVRTSDQLSLLQSPLPWDQTLFDAVPMHLWAAQTSPCSGNNTICHYLPDFWSSTSPGVLSLEWQFSCCIAPKADTLLLCVKMLKTDQRELSSFQKAERYTLGCPMAK